MVDFPLPVGPVTRIIPCGFFNISSNTLRSAGVSPSFDLSMLNPSLDAILITHFSPYTVGRLDTRISYSLPSTLMVIRPSCGFLFSEISIPDIILIRVVIAPRSVLSYWIISRRLPSILYLTRISLSIGSICISEALCLTACSITLLIS